MPAWIHDRAEHILAKNPSMPKSMAFALATQQSHAVGKSPKGYGTEEGRETAKAKYDTPKDDKKTANPGGLTSPKMEKKSMSDLGQRMLKGYEKIKSAQVTSHVETAGSTETNVDKTVAGKNPIAPDPRDQKGIPLEGFLWGQEPPKGNPLLGKRSPTHETFTSSAEEINKQDNDELLHRAFTNFAEASRVAKATIAQNLVNGKPGTYVTHAKTLIEKARDLG